MLNEFKLIGRLGADAEVRHTQSGIVVANLKVATSSRVKDKSSGQWIEKTTWHRLTFFNSERIANYLTKGKLVYADGRIEYSKYTNKEGVETYSTDLIVNNLQLLSKNESNESAPADAPVAGDNDTDSVPF
jgi:single-strand DNA-binding protein